jgi:hypothetical protein
MLLYLAELHSRLFPSSEATAGGGVEEADGLYNDALDVTEGGGCGGGAASVRGLSPRRSPPSRVAEWTSPSNLTPTVNPAIFFFEIRNLVVLKRLATS